MKDARETLLVEALTREGERLGVGEEGVRQVVAEVLRMVRWRFRCTAAPEVVGWWRVPPLLPATLLEDCAPAERVAWRRVENMVLAVDVRLLGLVGRVVGFILNPGRFAPPAGPLGTPPGGRLLLGGYEETSTGGGECGADGFRKVGGGVGGGAVVGGGGDLCGFAHRVPGNGCGDSEADGGARLGEWGVGGGAAAHG